MVQLRSSTTLICNQLSQCGFQFGVFRPQRIDLAVDGLVILLTARSPSSNCASSAPHGGEQQRLIRLRLAFAFALFTLALLASLLAPKPRSFSACHTRHSGQAAAETGRMTEAATMSVGLILLRSTIPCAPDEICADASCGH
jgi:hypothetical protein